MGNGSYVNEDVHEFWNKRASQGKFAGTRDIIAKQLEIDAISSFVHDGMKILEVGCGNGITATDLARQYDVDITGLDYANEMIDAAISLSKDQLVRGRVKFGLGDVRDLSNFSDKFDLIYTERVLINLPDWSAQKQAINNIADLLIEGGSYVMCENSQDGLDKVNELRALIGLQRIDPPWHNRYLHDDEVQNTVFSSLKLERIVFFSSTYYLLSRIVNAWLAEQEKKEPDYESPINQLALKLPAIGELGQGRIWLFRKY